MAIMFLLKAGHISSGRAGLSCVNLDRHGRDTIFSDLHADLPMARPHTRQIDLLAFLCTFTLLSIVTLVFDTVSRTTRALLAT